MLQGKCNATETHTFKKIGTLSSLRIMLAKNFNKQMDIYVLIIFTYSGKENKIKYKLPIIHYFYI